MAEKKEIKYEFIRIGSTRDIVVNPGIRGVDITDPTMAGVQNNFKVNEFWTKAEITIVQGNGFYPKFIQDWNSVKILSDDLNILSINSKVYSLEDLPEEIRAGAKKTYDDIVKFFDDYKKTKEKTDKLNAQKQKIAEDKAATLLAKAYAQNAQ